MKTKCWETGLELSMDRAFGLDRKAAVAAYERWAAKVHLLSGILSELGPSAGTGGRAEELGVPPFVRRVVCAAMAEAHESALGMEGLFRPLPELIAQRRQDWIARLLPDPELGPLVESMTPGDQRRLADTAAALRKRFDRDIYREAVRFRLDARLALARLAHEEGALGDWLTEERLQASVAALEIPEEMASALVAGVRLGPEQRVESEAQGELDLAEPAP